MRIDVLTLFPEACEPFFGSSILGRARQATDDVVRADASEELVEALRRHAPPLAPHGHLHRGMAEDTGSPFHRVDLRHEGHVDEPRMVEQVVVGPGGIGGTQALANRVVLQGEKGVHERQADPPVAVDAGDVDAGCGVDGE